MSILATLSVKPILLLTLRVTVRPIRGLGRLLCDAAEARDRAVSVTYLAAMGLPYPPIGEQPRNRHEW